MGMVFQHFNLFNNLSVMGNMTLAPVKLGPDEEGRGDRRGQKAAGARRTAPTRRTPSRFSCPAARSSASPSPGR